MAKDRVNGNCTIRINFYDGTFARDCIRSLESIAARSGCVVQKPHVSPAATTLVCAEFLNRICARGYFTVAMKEYDKHIQSSEFIGGEINGHYAC